MTKLEHLIVLLAVSGAAFAAGFREGKARKCHLEDEVLNQRLEAVDFYHRITRWSQTNSIASIHFADGYRSNISYLMGPSGRVKSGDLLVIKGGPHDWGSSITVSSRKLP